MSSHFSFFTLHRDDSTVGLKAGGGLNWILHSSYIIISLCAENKTSPLVNKNAGCNKQCITQLKGFYDNRSILSQSIFSHWAQPAIELLGIKVAIALAPAQYFFCNFLSGNVFLFLLPQKEINEAVSLQSYGDKHKVTHCSEGNFG